MPKVRLIGAEGEQLGVKTTDEAREYAYGKGLDLVEVAAQADPPVAKVMDFGKYRYELEQKAKAARKNQTQIHVKEIKLRPKIGQHDYETKRGHVVRFLNADRIQATEGRRDERTKTLKTRFGSLRQARVDQRERNAAVARFRGEVRPNLGFH